MFLIFLILNISFSYAGDSCPNRNASISLPFSSDISGVDCNPSNKDTWNPEWKSPCDCLNNLSLPLKSSIRAREIELAEKLNRKKIDEAIESKMAEKINSQLMFQFESVIRLDNLIKNGDLTEEDAQTNKIFSPSCRIGNIKNLFDNIKDNINNGIDCDREIFIKRSKLLFGTNDIDEWIKNQTNKFKSLVTNDLTKEDFEKGLCIPYKSFQAMNSSTHLRSTYLKVAKHFGTHDKFLEWAKNRSNPRDVFDFNSKPNTISSANTSILSKGSKFGSFNTSNNLSRGIANLQQDKVTDLLEINEDDITRLLKTDPIFEKLIRNESFFNTFNSKFNDELFNPNDKGLLKLIANESNSDCQKIFGTNKTASDNFTGLSSAKANKSILENFLCNKNIVDSAKAQKETLGQFRDILPSDTNGLNDYLIYSLAVCDPAITPTTIGIKPLGDSTFSSVPKFSQSKKLFALPQLTELFDDTLFPDSDLSSLNTKKNEYLNFNKNSCDFIKMGCDLSTSEPKSKEDCNTESVAGITLLSTLKKMRLKNSMWIVENIGDITVSDKQIRDYIKQNANQKYPVPEETISSILTLRRQNQIYQKNLALTELKGKLNYQGNSESLESEILKTGIDDFIKEKSINGDLALRLKSSLGNKYPSLLKEDTKSSESSFFANYFILGTKEDETLASQAINNQTIPTSNNVPQRGLANSDPSSTPSELPSRLPNGSPTHKSGYSNNTPITTGAPLPEDRVLSNNTSLNGSSTPSKLYTRRSFDESTTTIPPNGDDKGSKIPTPNQEKKVTESNSETKGPVKAKKDEREIISQSTTPQNNLGRALTLSRGGESTDSVRGDGETGRDYRPDTLTSDFDRLNKMNKELDKLNKDLADLEKLDKENNRKRKEELENEKRKLQDELFRTRRAVANSRSISNGNNTINNDNSFNNFDSYIGNNNDDNTYDSFNKKRGDEFDHEKFIGKPDDGTEEFEKKNKNEIASSGGDSAKAAKKPILTKGAGGDGSEASPNENRNTKNKRRPSGEALTSTEKCGTGRVLKCYFPNSIFSDPQIKSMLQQSIRSYKLEGRTFFTAEKIKHRRSKKGEKAKIERYLIKHTLTRNNSFSEKDTLSDDEQDKIFLEIKERKSDPKFSQKLIKYRAMTKPITPKKYIYGTEVEEVLKNTLSSDELKEYLDEIN